MSNSPSSPPFLNRLWPVLLPVLAAFGFPATVVAIFLTKHPLLALGAGVLYEILLFALGFIGKVWGKLEDSWAERTATWFDHRVQGALSHYRKQYYQYLRYQHRDFDVKGLSTMGTYTLELDQVFVELSIDPTTPQQAIINPIQAPLTFHQKSHSIWYYLASPLMSNQHLTIIGSPGSGKTTLLKHIALALATAPKRHSRSHAIKISYKMPILLFLRDHAQTIKEQTGFSLMDAIHDHLKKWEQPLPPENWFKRQLSKGRCLVMLDGLDEVADPVVRREVVNWVERQVVAYSRNRFLVTSRPFGYRSNPLSGMTVLEVCPFTREQVERFIYLWYLANEIMSKQKDDPGVRMRARAEAKLLLQRLRNTPALFDLTVNPLLLTMIATVHRYGGELPGNRAALYAEICEVFLGKRQQARGQILELTPAQMQLVLESLAHQLMIQGVRDFAIDEMQTVIAGPLAYVATQMTPKEFLQLVENASGLLVERESGIYNFTHQTFQEYLTAAYIQEKELGDTLATQVGTDWWRETIRLYCAMDDATPVIDACLANEHPSKAIVELAIDCEQEARKVQPEVRARLEKLLLEGVEDTDAERQHLIAGAFLSRRLRRMVHLKDETYIDTSLITCAEYQVFLDEQRERGHYFQPDHWISYHFPAGQGNLPVLGVRLSDTEALCKWLTERELGSWQYRLVRLDEFKEAGDESILSRLKAGTGSWVNGGAGFIWAKGGSSLSDSMIPEEFNRRDNYDLEQILASTRSRTHSQPFDLDRGLNRILANAINFAPTLAQAHTLTLARDLERDLANVLNRISTLNTTRMLGKHFDGKNSPAFLNDCIHFFVQMLASYLSYWLWGQPTSRNWSDRKRKDDMVQCIIDIYLDAYATFAVLEERIQGAFPAFEGVLVVKERRTENH